VYMCVCGFGCVLRICCCVATVAIFVWERETKNVSMCICFFVGSGVCSKYVAM